MHVSMPGESEGSGAVGRRFGGIRGVLITSLTWVMTVLSACSSDELEVPHASGGGAGVDAGGDAGSDSGSDSASACDVCSGDVYTPCVDGQPEPTIECPAGGCVVGLGCVVCTPSALTCVGNEVHRCSDDGQDRDELVSTCDVASGEVCSNGTCIQACELAAAEPSSVGCEFWAVDLDQQDAFDNDPASAPWGVVVSNPGLAPASINIEINAAPLGQPPEPLMVEQVTVDPGDAETIALPSRELDCGSAPNQYTAPGTCLSSNAYRITSSMPIGAQQFNTLGSAFSSDASLLLPTTALGKSYRVLGWVPGHPVPLPGVDPEVAIVDRAAITIVGVQANTEVTVRPSWRIKGNPPVPATSANGTLTLTLGAFDVLNLETDDANLADGPATAGDLSGSMVDANAPIAVFSNVESTAAPGSVISVPTPPGWDPADTCCLDHLEEQLFPVERLGVHYVIARSPVRSTDGFREPDILRFVGLTKPATVVTNLPPPFDSFTLAPGEVKTTWSQNNVVVSSDSAVMVGQLLVSSGYVNGATSGDPSLALLPPIEQYRTSYSFASVPAWEESWVVIAAEVGAEVTIDGLSTSSCLTEPAGTLAGKSYESRRCPLSEGVHHASAEKPFGAVVYGYGLAASYAFVAGTNAKTL